jgi:hypothetical protein
MCRAPPHLPQCLGAHVNVLLVALPLRCRCVCLSLLLCLSLRCSAPLQEEMYAGFEDAGSSSAGEC